MNNARLQELERSVSGIAKKVLGAVPIVTSWSAKEIHAELARLGQNVERQVVDGCLYSLKSSGLIREEGPGQFSRVQAKEKTAAAPTDAACVLIDDVPPAAKRDALDELADCAAKVRDLGYAAKALAERIEGVALRVAEDTQRIAADGQKLQQLRDLLKSVT